MATEWFEREQPTAAWGERYANGALDEVETYLLLSQQRAQDRQAAAQQAEREKAEAKERELQLAKELADAQGKKAATFRRMLIGIGLVTVVAIVLAVVALNATIRSRKALANLEIESTKSKAAALMAGLSGTSKYPTINEYESLRLLADSDEATRLAFMKQLLASAGKAERLPARYPYLLHAVVGLDVQEKERIKVLLSEYGRNPSKNKAINVAVAELGVLLVGDDTDFDKMVAMNFLAAMEKTTDPYSLSSLGSALGSLGEKLPGEQALALAQQIVAAMEKTTDSDALSSLGKALAALAVRMEAEDTSSVLKSIVSVGDTREKVLAGLGKKTGQEFDGQLWKAVKWLEEEKGIDLQNVPRFPIISEE